MKKILYIAGVMLSIASCAKEGTTEVENLSPTFTSSIVESRASGTEWETGDQIGIMVTQSNDIVGGYKYNSCYDVSFTDPTQGAFVANTPLDQIYYSMDEEVMLDFYAYYPYSAELVEADENYPISVAEQSVPQKIDFMEASTLGSGGYNKESDEVELSFSRNMAKLTLALKAGAGISLSEISAVTLTGFYTSAIYDFPTNTFGSLSGTTTDITPLAEGGSLYSAILIPESSSSQVVYFTLDSGEVIPLELTKYTLARGENLYFNVTVSRTEATCEVNTIAGWENDGVGGDIDTE